MGHFDFILQVIADCFIVLCDNKENNFILNNIIKQCQNIHIILFCIPPLTSPRISNFISNTISVPCPVIMGNDR